ncbi:M23 family metallopeptidase [Nocardioides speluncae]|uniref:M23 family metallopeptidase n=1 Tax=Nocardioides speluncae TaxID=2670337 RepID=UPI000D68FA4E|nr:M23 family metallopeptidase [Nocardioides speluncae]
MLAVGIVAVPFAHADDPDELKEKERRVQRQLNSAHDALEESSATARSAYAKLNSAKVELTAAQQQLARTRGKLAAAKVRDAQMQTKLENAIAKLKLARTQLAAGRLDVLEQRKEFGRTIASLYANGDPQLLGLAGILRSGDASEITRRNAAVDMAASQEDRRYDELKAAEVLLEVNETKVEDAKDEVQLQREAAADHLDLMETLEQQAEDDAASVRRLVTARSEAATDAFQAKQADLATLRELKAEQERIKEKLREAAEKARELAEQANQDAEGGSPHGGPQSGDGYLGYPVAGAVTSPFGYRVHPIYGYYSLHDGTDFGAGCGQPLYAGASGTVISSYYQTAWGNRLIIDHGFVRGVGLATIYNHASSYTAGVGDRVERGEVIGYVGTTGWSTGCHLHFTVTSNGNPVDPLSWL